MIYRVRRPWIDEWMDGKKGLSLPPNADGHTETIKKKNRLEYNKQGKERENENKNCPLAKRDGVF